MKYMMMTAQELEDQIAMSMTALLIRFTDGPERIGSAMARVLIVRDEDGTMPTLRLILGGKERMIRIASAQYFTTMELGKFEKAENLANEVMATDQFKKAVTEFDFDTTRDTGTEVYQRLMGQKWSVRFQILTPPWWKRWFSKEVAREDASGLVTFDRNKFQGQDLPSLANTIAHECCHVAGYRHATAHDYASVPYAVGNMVESIARSFAAQPPAVNPALAQAMAAARGQEGMTL
jgi:hypothetical protein